ncbi:unnamed protein product [Moneuplotes crassus]|uniref:Uncharacterized protein n=1 Tax=Euplotes crassus TaxID=5936 RepID=A0AAD1X2J4_EUPCR|nr:unnamed protein product [Moneuplotes crassus]
MSSQPSSPSIPKTDSILSDQSLQAYYHSLQQNAQKSPQIPKFHPSNPPSPSSPSIPSLWTPLVPSPTQNPPTSPSPQEPTADMAPTLQQKGRDSDLGTVDLKRQVREQASLVEKKLKRRFNFQKITLLKNIEAEVCKRVEIQKAAFKIEYDSQIYNLKQQFYENQMEIIDKNNLIKKLYELLSAQEAHIISQRATSEEKSLSFLEKLSNQVTMEHHKKAKSHQAEETLLKMEKELTESITKQDYFALERNYNHLKKQCEGAITDYGNQVQLVKKLQQEISDLKASHKIEIDRLLVNFEQEKKNLLDQNQIEKSSQLKYQKNLKTELKIQEELAQRFNKYAETMKKEIVLCKNVIKHPKMMQTAFRQANFNQFELYKYPNVPSTNKVRKVTTSNVKIREKSKKKFFTKHNCRPNSSMERSIRTSVPSCTSQRLTVYKSCTPSNLRQCSVKKFKKKRLHNLSASTQSFFQ